MGVQLPHPPTETVPPSENVVTSRRKAQFCHGAGALRLEEKLHLYACDFNQIMIVELLRLAT